MSNHIWAAELHKPSIRKFEKQKVYPSFKDNIWGAHLAGMLLINKLDKRIRFYDVLLIFSVNMHGLFLWNTEKVLQLLILYKIF